MKINREQRPIIFGAPYGIYVSGRTACARGKGYRLRACPGRYFRAGWAACGAPVAAPFGKIPAFEHAGFRLYEAAAITRYVDEALPGPPLQPADPRDRARMTQIVSILDSYAYRTLVWTSMSSGSLARRRVRPPTRRG